MTTWLQGRDSFFFGAQAFLVDNEHETASSWASKYLVQNPAYKWVLGRFVEADRANNNKQLFSLKGLQMARPTIAHAPMNMNHSSRRVVGSYVATDLVYPTDTAATIPGGVLEPGSPTPPYDCPVCGESVGPEDLPEGYDPMAPAGNPCPKCGAILNNDGHLVDSLQTAGVSDAGLNAYIEALGVFWRHYFPEEYALVEAAHKEGKLYYSMECIPAQIQCAGADGCGETFQYAGRMSDTYCAHLKEGVSDKYLIEPHFTAGAILVPPVRPGWSNADIHSLVAKHAELAEHIYDGVEADMSHLDPKEWEVLMAQLLALATV